MKTRSATWLGLLVLMASLALANAQSFSTPPVANAPAPVRLAPDTAEVLRQVRANMSDTDVIAYIKEVPRLFELTPEEATYLKNQGVPAKVIAAMRAHDRDLKNKWEKMSYEEPPSAPAASAKPAPKTPRKLQSPAASQIPPSMTPSRRGTNSPAASAASQRRVWTTSQIVEQAPPPPRAEIVPLSPGPDYYWIPGHWAYRNGSWIWLEGSWALRPHPGMVWLDGRWEPHGRSWIWIPGRWR